MRGDDGVASIWSKYSNKFGGGYIRDDVLKLVGDGLDQTVEREKWWWIPSSMGFWGKLW